jgi:hypothetical protein
MENHHDNWQEQQNDACTESSDQERRKDHRRTNASQGYAYIEMVGWMDRREKIRRNNDPSCF